MEISESWIQIISLFLANFAVILWFRAESRNDWRHMDEKLENFREDMKQFRELWMQESKEFNAKMDNFREIWLEESKEYHKRLCEIEAKRK